MSKSIASKAIILYSIIFTLISIGGPMELFSQEPLGIVSELQQFHPDKGTIRINQDEKITQLLNRYYIHNAAHPGMQGYRIRIYFDTGQHSREQSELVMTNFLQRYSGIAIYRTFDSPYYKISVGDFRTRDEAQHVLSQLIRKYPKAFIIPEWINFPRID